MKFSNILKSSAVVAVVVATGLLNSHESASGQQRGQQRCQESFTLTPQGGQTLEFERGKNWRTCSGYHLAFQNDGNLVLHNRRGRAIWSANGNSRADVFAIQRDGNVVLYRRGRPVWDTGTDGHRGASFAIQSDGNLVVYSRRREVLWTSNTHER